MVFAVAITGIPGVGKSTVCAALAKRLPVAAHVEADLLHRLIVSGGQWPSAATETAREQLVLRTRNAATVGANFIAANIPVFVDEVICTTEQLTLLTSALPDVQLIALTASQEVVLLRDAERSKQTAADYLDIAIQLQTLLGNNATWIDTTGLTVEQTVDEVWRFLPLP